MKAECVGMAAMKTVGSQTPQVHEEPKIHCPYAARLGHVLLVDLEKG